MVPVETTEEWLDSLGLGLDVLGEDAEWIFCCLGKMEDAEVALIVLLDDASESPLVSVFEVEDRLVLLKSSSMDFCFILSASWLLLWGLWILTGEPLMLTKALVLLTDLFIGGFCPIEVAGLMEGKALEIPLLSRLGRIGELRLLAGDGGATSFFGEEGTTGV